MPRSLACVEACPLGILKAVQRALRRTGIRHGVRDRFADNFQFNVPSALPPTVSDEQPATRDKFVLLATCYRGIKANRYSMGEPSIGSTLVARIRTRGGTSTFSKSPHASGTMATRPLALPLLYQEPHEGEIVFQIPPTVLLQLSFLRVYRELIWPN